MHNIRSGIIKYMILIAAVIMVVLLSVFLVLQIWGERHAAREEAKLMFSQIGQVLDENRREAEVTKADYSELCLENADTIAYIIEKDQSVAFDSNELKRIADMVNVDEIHIFDPSGMIVSGTHPQYYGYTFDSGEQMSFFKPLLSDKSLRLCQEITPNTAEGKLMQYSALWSPNGQFIVEVGMEPVNVMRVTEKNELSHIFKLLRAGAGISFYAMDKDTHIIMGSTDTSNTGQGMEEIGFTLSDIRDDDHSGTETICGVKSYCIFTTIDNNLIAYVVPYSRLYKRLPQNVIVFAIALMLIAVILVKAVTTYMEKHIINSIHKINEALTEISEGNLERNVNINGSVEFTELSSHINDMISSILSSTDKMSYILNRLNRRIGVYEYNHRMRSVRFTDYIPLLLGADEEETKRIKADHRLFEMYINALRAKPLEGEENVYSHCGDDKERYLRIVETGSNNDVFGIIMDVTNEIVTRRRIESERDMDVLTGLLNRRGVNSRLTQLFSGGDDLGYGAVMMLDADDLKLVNDTYGHNKGDEYLRRIAELVSGFGARKNVSARLGGDEFVTMLYGYGSKQEINEDIERFMQLQDGGAVRLGDDITVKIKFSAGYSFIKGQDNYHILLRAADEMMYENKRKRKKALEINGDL